MNAKNEFVQYVVEDLLSGFGGVSARAMFGGYGVYKDGVIFAIIVDDELYFKVNETNQKEFEAMKSSPFTYKAKGGKEMKMSYWKLSEDVLENREELLRLADLSFEISLKAGLEKKKKKLG